MATTNLGLTTINQSDNISPTPINDNMEKIDSAIAALRKDYVTQQGTSGIWRYRRWNSGIYECWGSQYLQTPAVQDVSFGTATVKAFSTDFGFPVTFAAAPVVCVSVWQDGTITAGVMYTKPTTANVQCWVLNAAENQSVTASAYVIGRVS